MLVPVRLLSKTWSRAVQIPTTPYGIVLSSNLQTNWKYKEETGKKEERTDPRFVVLLLLCSCQRGVGLASSEVPVKPIDKIAQTLK